MEVAEPRPFAGKKVAILAGRGALGAGAQLEQTAELLGAPIIKALLGRSCVPDDSPYTTGGLGLLGTLPSEEAMEECDTLLIVGSSLPYIEFEAPYRRYAPQATRELGTDALERYTARSSGNHLQLVECGTTRRD